MLPGVEVPGDALNSLANQIAELLLLARVIVGLLVIGLVVGAPFAVRLSRRIRGIETRQARLEEQQARIEAWQAKHSAPLERLAIEQDAAGDPARAAAVRRPQRGGSPDAPL